MPHTLLSSSEVDDTRLAYVRRMLEQSSKMETLLLRYCCQLSIERMVTVLRSYPACVQSRGINVET